MTDPKSDPHRLLLAFLLSMILFPVNAIITVKLLELTWGWFAAPTWPQPTAEQWFGVVVAWVLITSRYREPTKEEHESALRPVQTALTSFIVRNVSLVLTVMTASLLGMLMGWK